MGKLLTEDSVRQLMKQNKLIDQGSLTLPRGTILTPSARSFLAEHQIRIGAGPSNAATDATPVQVDQNPWIDTLYISSEKVDFAKIANYRIPLFQLQMTVREQGILWLSLLRHQQVALNQKTVTSLVSLVNALLAAKPNEVTNLKEFPWEEVQLENLGLNKPQPVILQQMSLSIEKVVTALAQCLVVEPNLNETVYYQAIVRWQTMIQDWLQTVLKVGEDDAKSK
ncbi:hypothetical protein [Levilactobacillus namurensis]|uniref:hypothetical protein n=1 Tax=Levilactobacillus namurensis TaxID=380393 RepID=UPI000463385D|nr:hypothetical protein [Levilactobacillus namurensis]